MIAVDVNRWSGSALVGGNLYHILGVIQQTLVVELQPN